jgi:ribA/ribD-fused uncharacterized protein
MLFKSNSSKAENKAWASRKAAEPIRGFVGELDFLSNFYPSPFTWKGEVYKTAEHAYQAAKTENKEEQEKIIEAETPGRAKRLGSKATLRENWDRKKVIIMSDILKAKFTSTPELRAKLRDTAPRPIFEENTGGDEFWGVCNGKGNNFLGRVLEALRDLDSIEDDA